uniref:global nitrogen transcriptional regulator n=1 Tax=Erythrolobus coxiae TaxID=362235 RepID=UPI001FCD9D8E|nr:global nitrogen transcriptional regulator [Erythrolobus coxiae]UNJ17724.1 global nitrogen transcriptional regulator [Erythrolobus coxiae]
MSYKLTKYYDKNLKIDTRYLTSAYIQTSIYHTQITEILIHREIQNRFIILLLNLCCEFGRYVKYGILLDLSLSHNNIASIIGTTRSTITRIIAYLKKQKLITVYKKKFIIFDLLALNYQLS